MKGFLAAVKQLGSGLVYIDPLSPVDPGFGGGRPGGGDPGYGIPDWGPTDPGFGGGRPGGVDPDWGMGTFPHPGHGLPGYGHPGNRPPGSWAGRPGNALPIAPVRPSVPIVLPPITVWPPHLPPGIDNTLPPEHGHPDAPVVIPPDPSIGIDHPIYLPQLPAGSALIIALTGANVPAPKEGVPANAKPAILWQGAGTKPVLVYVTAAAAPK